MRFTDVCPKCDLIAVLLGAALLVAGDLYPWQATRLDLLLSVLLLLGGVLLLAFPPVRRLSALLVRRVDCDAELLASPEDLCQRVRVANLNLCCGDRLIDDLDGLQDWLAPAVTQPELGARLRPWLRDSVTLHRQT